MCKRRVRIRGRDTTLSLHGAWFGAKWSDKNVCAISYCHLIPLCFGFADWCFHTIRWFFLGKPMLLLPSTDGIGLDGTPNVVLLLLNAMPVTRNRPVSQMRAPLAACRQWIMTLIQTCYMFLNIKRTVINFNPCPIYPHCGILTH